MHDGVPMATLIDVLKPWHARVVFVGGWAHRLHRLHPSASVPRYQPVVTRDVDVVLDPAMRLQGDIARTLQAAGFSKRLVGEHRPPVSHFQVGDNDAGFYVEFLSPLRGSALQRDGTENATESIAGVTTRRLRHLEVLLCAPWEIALAPTNDLPIAAPARLLVVNPVSFIVQRLLIHNLRPDDKKAQDLLYIHDTIELFGTSLAMLHALWSGAVRPALRSTERATAIARCDTIFCATTDTIRNAVRKVAADRQLSPNELRLRTSIGLEEIFRSRSAPP